MHADADLELIEASRRGDCRAFAQIIERYQRPVHAIAFSGVRDRALADDIAQDAFVIAWRRLGELRDASRLPAWLCGIARNLARDARKRRQREVLGEPEVATATSTPFDELNEAESERIVSAALGEVPDVYREPLVLFYYKEHSVDDVARSLGITAATTHKRLSRGRRYLAERVALVERGLARCTPRPGLAASVVALLGVTASASHVDASTASKGSTMHKLTLAAAVTATVGGAAIIVVTATRGGDAHAGSSASSGTTPVAAAASHDHCGTPRGSLAAALFASRSAPRAQAAPTLHVASGGQATDSPPPTDCNAVGRYLADLEADTTHGPSDRPDDETGEQCASHYAAKCESEHWNLARRTCTLAAADLINAHLCAGAVATTPPSSGTATSLDPALACAALSTHVATTVQSAGVYADVADFPQQIEASCQMGDWPIELRRCLRTATTVTAMHACIEPTSSGT